MLLDLRLGLRVWWLEACCLWFANSTKWGGQVVEPVGSLQLTQLVHFELVRTWAWGDSPWYFTLRIIPFFLRSDVCGRLGWNRFWTICLLMSFQWFSVHSFVQCSQCSTEARVWLLKWFWSMKNVQKMGEPSSQRCKFMWTCCQFSLPFSWQ
jgi:hypothetical protein